MRLTWGGLLVRVGLFGLAALLIGVLSLFIGATAVDPRNVLDALLGRAPADAAGAWHIVLEQRLPRALLGGLVGAALGMAGTGFQAILRNPLADPYTLGVASGSAVGAVIAISFKLDFALGPFSSVEVFALLGAGLISVLIYGLARGPMGLSMNALLLAGVTLALIGAAAVLFIRYLTEPHRLVEMDRWMMGGLAVVGYREVVGALPLFLPGAIILGTLVAGMNQIAFGEELAMGRGVDVAVLQRWAFVGGSLVTAAAVAVAGPIGFVGLIVPHAVRGLIGPDHRVLLPCAALASAAFLVACDTVARTLVAPAELPVGVVTAICGGPFFLWLLVRVQRRAG